MLKVWFLLPIIACSGVALADPPPAIRSDVQTRAETSFADADRDQDGWLTRAEYRAAILAVARRFNAKVTPQGLAAADAQFDAVDSLHAGRISRAQFVAAALGHFDGADLNHDGKVTPDEARKAAKKIKAKAEKAP